MLCPNCKKEIENGAVFCEHCGTRIKKSKKGLWITLSVIVMAVIATIVVITIQERQEQIVMELHRAAQHQRELEQQLQAERKAREEAELRKYIDLGLPSGTLWKESNEGGDYAYYTFDEAIIKFGNKLPTKQQLEDLQINVHGLGRAVVIRLLVPMANPFICLLRATAIAVAMCTT